MYETNHLDIYGDSEVPRGQAARSHSCFIPRSTLPVIPVDLTEHGWEEPVDELPFDLPSGWQGGHIVNTGSNIFCRTWEHPETNVEVIYNTNDPGIGVQKQEEPSASIELIDTLDAPSVEDSDKIEVAREYIQEEFDPSDI